MKFTYAQKKALPSNEFALPSEHKYPIPDAAHARNALARVSQFGSPEEKSKVRSAVHSKWASILQAKKGKE